MHALGVARKCLSRADARPFQERPWAPSLCLGLLTCASHARHVVVMFSRRPLVMVFIAGPSQFVAHPTAPHVRPRFAAVHFLLSSFAPQVTCPGQPDTSPTGTGGTSPCRGMMSRPVCPVGRRLAVSRLSRLSRHVPFVPSRLLLCCHRHDRASVRHAKSSRGAMRRFARRLSRARVNAFFFVSCASPGFPSR